MSCMVFVKLRKQNQGYIINISSLGGIIGLPFQGFYSTTKFAIESFSEALSAEVKAFRIKVIIIEPGDFCTNFTLSRKIITNASEHSIYKDKFQSTMKVIEKDEYNGCNPIILAKSIERIINNPSPKLRYIVGSKTQKLSVKLKKILPQRIFEKIIMNHYKC